MDFRGGNKVLQASSFKAASLGARALLQIPSLEVEEGDHAWDCGFNKTRDLKRLLKTDASCVLQLASFTQISVKPHKSSVLKTIQIYSTHFCNIILQQGKNGILGYMYFYQVIKCWQYMLFVFTIEVDSSNDKHVGIEWFSLFGPGCLNFYS